jgi:hypothetical protein
MLDPYQDWLGISKKQRPISCYQLLGLSTDELDRRTIERAAAKQLARIKAHQEGPHAAHAARLAKQIKQSAAVLLDPAKRLVYDTHLQKLAPKKEIPAELPSHADEEILEVEEVPEADLDFSAVAPKKPSEPKMANPAWLWAVVGSAATLAFLGVAAVLWWALTGKTENPSPKEFAQVSLPVQQAVTPPIATKKEPERVKTVAEPSPTAASKQPVPVSAPAPAAPIKEAPPPQPITPTPEPKTAPKPAKLPVPSAEVQAAAEKALKKQYAADYADTKPEGAQALAAKFLQPGRENRNDPAAWFVLLREARDLAMQAGSARMAIEAVDEMDQQFVIDAPAQKAQVLSTVSQAPGERAARSVAEAALGMIEPALAADDYDAAQRLIGIAETAAEKMKSHKKAKGIIAARETDIERYHKDYQEVIAARSTLKHQPNDTAANLRVGKYVCYFHGRWDEGLPFLHRGSDETLKGIAGKDLARPTETAAQIALADTWWGQADSLKDRDQLHCWQRAKYWYDQARPKAEAFQKDKVESRIKKAQDREAALATRLLPGSFYGRDIEDRVLLLRQGGGTMQSEEAVERGLKWLSLHQAKSGKWALDAFDQAGNCNCGDPGGKYEVAGTALALLPFLGHGNTHANGPYSATVNRGIRYLLSVQKHEGNFSDSAYENALATIALCEDYGLTRTGELRPRAQLAVNYIVRAQHQSGSWGYSAGTQGDLSVSGFQFTALKTAVYAGLFVPAPPLVNFTRFLESVADPNGIGYGYKTPSLTPSMTAVGLLCREYLGWGPTNPSLARGVNYVAHSYDPSNSAVRPGMYYLYYAGQVVHHFGDKEWQHWNARWRDWLIEMQDRGTTIKHQEGSWSPQGDPWVQAGGRIFVTSLALLNLEVYYLNVPLFNYTDTVLPE